MRHLLAASGHVVAGAPGYPHREVDWVAGTVLDARALVAHLTRWPRVPVSVLGGARLGIETPYVLDDLHGRPGPTRSSGRRGPSGSGCYPVLEALGIARHATPALRSEVARQAARTWYLSRIAPVFQGLLAH